MLVAEDWYTNDYPDEEESDRDAEEDLSGGELAQSNWSARALADVMTLIERRIPRGFGR